MNTNSLTSSVASSPGNKFLNSFSEYGELKEFPPDAELFRQGQPIRNICLLKDGVIKFTCTDAQGKEVSTEWRGPGRILGAVTVIAQRPALVTASALIACRIYCISAATFLQLMETDAEFMRSVLEVTSRQAYEQTFRYTQLAMASVRTRLAQVLLDLVPDAQNNGAKSGQLTSATDLQNQTRNRAYEYDKLGRLKKVKGGVNAFYTPDWWQDYGYDLYGNRTSVTKTGGGTNIPLDGLASLSASATSNRITSANFEYDAAGNQTKAVIDASGTVQQYRYDAAGRLAQVLNGSGGVLATYSYGANNQRLLSVEGGVTTYYGWGGGQVIAEYAPAGASGLLWQTGYLYLGGRLLATMNGAAGSGTRFHHPDRLGTRIVTDQSNAELVTVQAGMPFGTQQPTGGFGGDNSWQHATKNNPSKKRFTSYDRSDATGLDYAVNRFYQSAQGRFTQVDPIGMSATSLTDPQTLNLYSYCGNDPINQVDTDGLFWGKLFGWIGKALKWIGCGSFRTTPSGHFTSLRCEPFALPSGFVFGVGRRPSA